MKRQLDNDQNNQGVKHAWISACRSRGAGLCRNHDRRDDGRQCGGVRPRRLSCRLRRISGCRCRAPSGGRCLPQRIGERRVGAPLRLAQDSWLNRFIRGFSSPLPLWEMHRPPSASASFLSLADIFLSAWTWAICALIKVSVPTYFLVAGSKPASTMLTLSTTLL